VRQCLDQLELRGGHEGEHALRHLFVVERIGHLVGERGVAAVDRQLDVEHHGLFDAALPIDKADDAFGSEAVQEDAIARQNAVTHALTAGSDSSGHWARAWMARSSCWPASRRLRPATAIIAALSVENSIRG